MQNLALLTVSPSLSVKHPLSSVAEDSKWITFEYAAWSFIFYLLSRMQDYYKFSMKLSFIIIIAVIGVCHAQTSNTCFITNCTTCLNSTYCAQCQPTSILQSGICLSCVNIINNCLNCSLTAAGNAICLNCSNGFYMNGSNCLACANPCVTCSNATACISCNLGLYLDLNN